MPPRASRAPGALAKTTKKKADSKAPVIKKISRATPRSATSRHRQELRARQGQEPGLLLHDQGRRHVHEGGDASATRLKVEIPAKLAGLLPANGDQARILIRVKGKRLGAARRDLAADRDQPRRRRRRHQRPWRRRQRQPDGLHPELLRSALRRRQGPSVRRPRARAEHGRLQPRLGRRRRLRRLRVLLGDRPELAGPALPLEDPLPEPALQGRRRRPRQRRPDRVGRVLAVDQVRPEPDPAQLPDGKHTQPQAAPTRAARPTTST